MEFDSDRIGLSIFECVNAPGGVENLQNLVNTMLIKGEAGEIEGEVGEPSGRKTTVVVRGTPLLDGDERTIGGVVFFKPIPTWARCWSGSLEQLMRLVL